MDINIKRIEFHGLHGCLLLALAHHGLLPYVAQHQQQAVFGSYDTPPSFTNEVRTLFVVGLPEDRKQRPSLDLPLVNADHHKSDWVLGLASRKGDIGFLGFCLGLIWGSWIGFFECRVEDEDARDEMMEKKMLAQRSDLGCEEDDLVVVNGVTKTQSGSRGVVWCETGGEDGGDSRVWRVNGGFAVMVEDDGDLLVADDEVDGGGDRVWRRQDWSTWGGGGSNTQIRT
ncbi:hypothetical protein V8G54_026509 [Vigna mungo]|uniref:Uncharacterized protein n=1 Tax=Vigna mungo TaxID=3915 RepID=A0AAQ3N0X9_VIGMU